MTNNQIFKDIEKLLDRADELEREDKANPKKKIPYVEFMARRYNISVDEMKKRMGLED